MLWDEVDYRRCPACGAEVDWVDLRVPLWCCAGCATFVNADLDAWPRCADCDLQLDRIHRPTTPPIAPPSRATSRARLGLSWLVSAYSLVMLAQLVVLALDPVGFIFVAPLVLVIGLTAVIGLVVFVAALPELASLVRDRSMRVVHGLEHACIHMLGERDLRVIRGATHDGGFEVELPNDGRAATSEVRTAIEGAIARVGGGDHALAYSPRCGTSQLVAMVLVGLVIVGGAAIGWVAGISLQAVVAIVAGAALLARIAARPLGLLAQRHLTVSTTFTTATVGRIDHTVSADGATARFRVGVRIDA